MCDYSVFVKGGAKVFLGRPTASEDGHGRRIDRRGTGWRRDAFSRVSGLSDYLAVDEPWMRFGLGREIVASLQWEKVWSAAK